MDLSARFWVKVDRSTDSECWPWLGARWKDGYARVSDGGRRLKAHRIAYTLTVGPIPDGLQVDHQCHNQAFAEGRCAGGPTCLHRRCVNPRHLTPATPAQNAERGACGAHQRAKTHCPAGHAYSPENTRTSGRARQCRTCARDHMRGYRADARIAA